MMAVRASLVFVALLAACQGSNDSSTSGTKAEVPGPPPASTTAPVPKPAEPLVDSLTYQFGKAVQESVAIEREKLQRFKTKPERAPEELSSSFQQRYRDWENEAARAWKSYRRNLGFCVPGGMVVDMPPGSCLGGTLGSRLKALPKGWGKDVQCVVVDVVDTDPGERDSYQRLLCAIDDSAKAVYSVVGNFRKTQGLKRGALVRIKGQIDMAAIRDEAPSLLELERVNQPALSLEVLRGG